MAGDAPAFATAVHVVLRRSLMSATIVSFATGKQPYEDSSTATPLNNQQPLPELGSPKSSTEPVRDALVQEELEQAVDAE